MSGASCHSTTNSNGHTITTTFSAASSSIGPGSSRKMVTVPQDGVVIQAGFSILPPSITKAPFRTRVSAKAAHKEPHSESARLSATIKDFLKRSDHIQEQWEQMNGKRAAYRKAREQTHSRAAISIRGYQISHSSSFLTSESKDDSEMDSMSLLDACDEFSVVTDGLASRNSIALDQIDIESVTSLENGDHRVRFVEFSRE